MLAKISLFLALPLLLLLFSCSKKENPPPVDNTASHTITDINPSTGSKGTEVIISGTGFNLDLTANEVKFNGVSAVVVSATATELVVEVPTRAKDGAISVTISSKTAPGPAFDYLESYTVSTIAGSGSAAFANGTGTVASFYYPTGLTVDGSGNIYVADNNNNRIRKISPAGEVTTLAGNTSGGLVNATGTAARFREPVGVAVDGNGNVYVADGSNHRIRKVTPAGVVTSIAGGNSGYYDATGISARFYVPYAITIDASGDLFVAERYNHTIRKVTQAGEVTTVAGSTTSGYENGMGTAAKFNSPGGIAVDPSGNLYVGDISNHCIRKITSAGVVTTLAGTNEAGMVNGVGSSARFYYPHGLAVDADGNVYVADATNHVIRKITPAGVVTDVAGSSLGYQDGIGSNSSFNYPNGIAIDSEGVIYIADTHNHRIRKIIID